MNRAITLFASALTFGAFVASPVQAETKVGFVYVGPPGDLGWTYRHDIGRQAVEALDGITTTALENVPEGPEAVEAITQLAETGHDLIFTTSFGFMDATNEVAGAYPDIKFEHATGYIRAHPNVTTFSARFYEGRVVEGLIAAKVTESNKIGYIASFPIPEVIRGINAFMLEAKKHNPDVEVEIVWVFTWFDPAKEAAAAQALIDHVSTRTPQRRCRLLKTLASRPSVRRPTCPASVQMLTWFPSWTTGTATTLTVQSQCATAHGSSRTPGGV